MASGRAKKIISCPPLQNKKKLPLRQYILSPLEIVLLNPPLMNDRVGFSLTHKKLIPIIVQAYGSCQKHANKSKLNYAAFGRTRPADQFK